MPDKPIVLASDGTLKEIAGAASSVGAADAGRVVVLNAAGQIDATQLPVNTQISVTASEAIAAGALVNLWSNAGAANVRNADNGGLAKRAHGFAPAAIAQGAAGTVSLWGGENVSVSTLTPGANYLLGTNGGVTTTPPTAAGSIVQPVGVARTATELSVTIAPPVVRA